MNTNAIMTTETSTSVHQALLEGFVDTAEDGTLCFVSDRQYRSCPACGTVFVGSAWRAAFIGPQTCPFCGRGPSTPIIRAGEA